MKKKMTFNHCFINRIYQIVIAKMKRKIKSRRPYVKKIGRLRRRRSCFLTYFPKKNSKRGTMDMKREVGSYGT